MVFTVQSVMDGIERVYEMKYEIQTSAGIYINCRSDNVKGYK